MNYEMRSEELITSKEVNKGIMENTVEITAESELAEMSKFMQESDLEYSKTEQREMNEGVKTKGEGIESEQNEMNEGVKYKIGYSSEYYEHKMAKALENGNRIAYENAKKDWAKTTVKEETKK